MGKVYSLLTRPIRTFNVESRAERVITREKPIPAPEYTAEQKQREEVKKLYPNFMETHNKKNPKLDDYLKNVFVVSKDPQEVPSSIKLLGTKGKCTFNEVVEFLNLYQHNPKEYTVEKISQDYNLDKQTVENIVSHFQILSKTTMKEMNIILNKEAK
ncbi:Protein NDUFAF4 homolog [Anthophora quadrimaculata]